MKNKILILLALLLLTGCKAKYNLQINFGGNVIETSNIYINSSLIGKNGYSDDKDEFLDQIAENYNFDMMPKKMKFKENNYVGYNTYHKYNSLAAYSKNSPAIDALYNGLSVIEDKNRVTIKTIGDSKISEYHNISSDTASVVEKIEVNISLPYKVIKTNANSIDRETNTFTWTFNGNSKSGIVLEYQTDAFFTDNPLYLMKFVSIYIYISIALLLGILIIFAVAKSKADRVNRI